MMSFLHIFLAVAPPSVLTGLLVYVAEFAWSESNRKKIARQSIARVLGPDTRGEMERLLPFEPQALPWKTSKWSRLA